MTLENTRVYKPIDKYARKLIKTHHMIKVGQHSRDTPGVSAVGKRSVLLEEGTLKLCADLVALLLLLRQELLELVCRETHFGLAAPVGGAVGPQPGALQTLRCRGAPPAGHTHLYPR